MNRSHIWIVFCVVMLSFAFTRAAGNSTNGEKSYFKIQVLDDQTGRGVPLVELETTNLIRYVTDSHGTVAFNEPGLMDQEVFFSISSHGYEYPKDGFGYAGKRIRITPGGSASIKIKRINIAERLYRMTGQGIYRDSTLLGDSVPLANPVINARVMGQDSVQTCWYNNKLRWFWGDTSRPSYPLGQFATSGAVSALPGMGGLDPSKGVDLHYFIDKSGFSKKMAPLDDPGVVWLDGFFTVEDTAGRNKMLAVFARLKGLSELLERGLMSYDDNLDQFVPIVRKGRKNLFLYSTPGHPFGINNQNEKYVYFAAPFPLSVQMRVKTSLNIASDPDKYEVYTALTAPGQSDKFRWVSSGQMIKNFSDDRSALIKELKREKDDIACLYDIRTGDRVTPHGGSVHWNDYREKWIMITVQSGGKTSYLGEVWYAEADTPIGPWSYARKIMTHNSYSFYNPKHHPYFDQEGGSTIYFEGTYSHTFSGTPEKATPRYDYNQIMYGLDLCDQRLCLPQPVYEIKSASNTRLILGEQIRQYKKTTEITRIPFYAISPDRRYEGLIPVCQQVKSGKAILSTKSNTSIDPLFYAAATDHADKSDNLLVGLFEYTNARAGLKKYSTENLDESGWTKSNTPLCYVWKNPKSVYLADWSAEPRKIWP